MNERDDLLEWMAVWQTDEPIPRDLRDELQRRVLRSQRRWRIAAVIEIVIGTDRRAGDRARRLVRHESH